MKAMVWTAYGPPEVLQLREVGKPAPKENEVLVKIHATTVLIGDCELRSFRFSPVMALPLRILLGFRKPTRVTILGQELAGEVEAVGNSARRFKPGDRVVAATMLHLSTYAEYTCVPESYVVSKPPDISDELAVTIPTGGIYGLFLVRHANLRPGQKVVVVGAGGSIGTYAVQIAKTYGAHVCAVDHGDKLAMLQAIGADQVIDYTQEDFTRRVETYDAIIDVIGKSPYNRSLRRLSPGGRYILGNPSLLARIRAPLTSARSGKQVVTATAGHRAEDYATLFELIQAGKITPVIDRIYPLEQLADAHRYVDSGQKKGNVVITVA